MRSPSSTDFKVSVEGIGDFVFGQRTMRDEAKIQAEYRRITESLDDPGQFLHLVGSWLSAIKVLMVAAPSPKWEDVDALDPLDEDVYAELSRVFSALREKEGSFRRKPGKGNAAVREDDVAVGGVLVSPPVQPPAD